MRSHRPIPAHVRGSCAARASRLASTIASFPAHGISTELTSRFAAQIPFALSTVCPRSNCTTARGVPTPNFLPNQSQSSSCSDAVPYGQHEHKFLAWRLLRSWERARKAPTSNATNLLHLRRLGSFFSEHPKTYEFLVSVLQLSTFFELDDGVAYSIAEFERKGESFDPALQFQLACMFRVDQWIKPAFQSLMKCPDSNNSTIKP
ncbi:hypothetical protein B0H13DRAFT_1858951 [Mycena leptocephala]|nr:hypothetical protein B0H13DRAFT_1858951 [Mycena leptocephala]